MGWIKKNFTGINAAISASAIMCFVQFVSGLVGVFRTGIFDGDTIEKLLASFDGFESVILFVVMIVLNRKKK